MELLGRRNSRRITVGVAAVVGASASYVLALGRLRELPDFGEADGALGGAWRRFRKRAAGRGWAGIVNCPVDDMASGSAVANVFGCNNVAVIFRGDAGAVDAGAESGGGDGIDPGVDVGLLLRQHAAALLLIEEDDGLRGKAFAAGSSCGGLGVGAPQFFGVSDGFHVGLHSPVDEPQDSATGGTHAAH